MLKAAGGAALAVARAKALAQDAVKSDGAGSVNQALVGYKLTLKELEATRRAEDTTCTTRIELRELMMTMKCASCPAKWHEDADNVCTLARFSCCSRSCALSVTQT